MALELSTHHLDFDIYESDYNPKTMVFLDKSSYMETPEKPKLEVILPGFVDSKVVPINPNSLNVLNTSALGISSINSFEDLPDGAYTLTYRICPHEENLFSYDTVRI